MLWKKVTHIMNKAEASMNKNKNPMRRRRKISKFPIIFLP
jgi:hypothetical protein